MTTPCGRCSLLTATFNTTLEYGPTCPKCIELIKAELDAVYDAKHVEDVQDEAARKEAATRRLSSENDRIIRRNMAQGCTEIGGPGLEPFELQVHVWDFQLDERPYGVGYLALEADRSGNVAIVELDAEAQPVNCALVPADMALDAFYHPGIYLQAV